MNIDEAEAWLWAQDLAWGYGPQPPLYIWLQGMVFHVTGASVFGLALLKAGLLVGILFASQGLASRWSGTERIPPWFAGAAALMLFWLPEFAWESQRIRTHNVLASLVAFLAVWQALRLRDAPSHFNHALLGILLGWGLLSKWNFAIFGLAVIMVLVMERAREALSARMLIWLVVLPCVMTLPTVVWMAGHPSVALASYHKLGIQSDIPWYAARGEWILASLRALFSFASLPLLVFGGFFLFDRASRTERPILAETARNEMRFVIRACALALAFLLIGGALKGATVLQARWLLPLLAPGMPAIAFLLLARLPEGTRRTLVRVTLAVPMVVMAGMAVILIKEAPYRYFNGSLTAPVLPLNDDQSPYLASVRMAAHLKAMEPDLVLKDDALLMAGQCPERLTVLEPEILRGARLMAWLVDCSLVAEDQPPRVPLKGSEEGRILRFVRR